VSTVVCGNCTVLVAGSAVRSCLVLAVGCDATEVQTAEDLADPDGGLNKLQQAFHEEHACSAASAPRAS
jgi:aerobic-type carbon monoxide dehydrogenase small subunit (CoxS/CutS family)